MQAAAAAAVEPPSRYDLPAFVPYACTQLQAPFRVRILVESQEEYVSSAVAADKGKKVIVKAKSTAHTSQSPTRTSSERAAAEESKARPEASDEDEIVVAAIHDSAARLVELSFRSSCEIPRLLMQILAMSVPFQPHLERLTVRRVRLPGAVLYEIGKLLPLSQLTDVCLDDSPVPERNYGALLEHERMRRLSLARCELDDDECISIAEALAHTHPASHNLQSLSLACNAIGSAGAVALAEALRSNRTLQHLDLSGNRVTDSGASALFRSLAEFPLTYEELTTKRRRFVEFLRLRREVYLRCLSEITHHSASTTAEEAGRGAKRRAAGSAGSATVAAGAGAGRGRKSVLSVGSLGNTSESPAMRADTMANELLGAHTDPFGLEETVTRDGYVYSLGNMSLCYLNLAYNELSHPAAAALLGLLRYQAALVRKAGPGLLRVLVDGNPLPVACEEYAAAGELLEHAVLFKLSKPVKKPEKSKSKSFHK